MASKAKEPEQLKVPVEPTQISVVAGLDTASDRWHLYCNTGQQYSARVSGKKHDPDERRHYLFDRARDAFGLLPGNALIVCEEPLALQNGKTTRLLGMAAGAIWAAHLGYDVFWTWANVSAWKLKVIGKGNADKAAIAAWVKENMGLTFPESDPDFYDAAALSYYGELALGLQSGQTTTHS